MRLRRYSFRPQMDLLSRRIVPSSGGDGVDSSPEEDPGSGDGGIAAVADPGTPAPSAGMGSGMLSLNFGFLVGNGLVTGNPSPANGGPAKPNPGASGADGYSGDGSEVDDALAALYGGCPTEPDYDPTEQIPDNGEFTTAVPILPVNPLI